MDDPLWWLSGLLMALLLIWGCGSAEEPAPSRGGGPGGGHGASAQRSGGPPTGGGPRGGGRPGGGPRGGEGVPVEVVRLARTEIASYFETNGTLEAENEVDLVARSAGPIVELSAEEGERVRRGQVLARIDDREILAQLEVARVGRQEALASFERSAALHRQDLISQEAYDAALARRDAARGDVERLEVQLDYTTITAPFDGLVVARYVKFAETVAVGGPLFRVSDFDPLLCPIQVPERELSRLAVGQQASLEVEAWPGERFRARVLRLSPVIEAATGTVKVTLEVAGQGRLRPGMFASVFLEMERRSDALVVPKAALALDSLSDTVFVAEDGTARRRPITLGFRSGDHVEVTDGLEVGEQVVVVGQDGLSEGTPIDVLRVRGLDGTSEARGEPAEDPRDSAAGSPADRTPPGRAVPPNDGQRPEGSAGERGGFGGALQPGELTPERIKEIRQRMRQRGLTDEQIDERLKRVRERADGGA